MAAPRIPPARAAALHVLRACLREGQDLQPALDETVRGLSLDQRDAALAAELCYGSLRLLARLDAMCDAFLKAPGKIPARLRDALRVAAYELHFCDRVPDYAAVDWAVTFARSVFGNGLGGLTNAVLRNVARLGAQAHDPAFYRQGAASHAAFLARFWSCPEWIVSLWLTQYGEEGALDYLKAQAAPAPLGLRVNARREGHAALCDELAARPGLLLRDDFCLAFAPGSLPLREIETHLAQGRLSRQSAAAQAAMHGLDCLEWESGGDSAIWDACAGRGGKTLLLAEQGRAPLLASDVSLRRIAALPGECRRLGLPRIPALLCRAEEPPLRGWRGTILLDAPCSGLGVLSRRPDSKWKRTPAECAGLARLQRHILESALDLVDSGGRVVYLTCTLNRKENQDVVHALLRQRPDVREEIAYVTPPDGPFGEFFFGVTLRKD